MKRMGKKRQEKKWRTVNTSSTTLGTALQCSIHVGRCPTTLGTPLQCMLPKLCPDSECRSNRLKSACYPSIKQSR